MSQPIPTEPVSVVIPVLVAGDYVGPALRNWSTGLERLHVPYELLVVDDGTNEEFTAKLAGEVPKLPHARLLRHDLPQGFGACLRTALPETQHPLFFYTSLDYPYAPVDLGKLLTRIAHTDEYLKRQLDVVSGCRTGRPVPGVWRVMGQGFRGFSRFALGLPLDPLPGWLGFHEHLRSWIVWLLFGDPLTDPNSAFKLFRKSVFDKFPIQCDGQFVHVELIAKATFITCLMDELPLTPKPDPLPAVPWGEFWKVLRDPKFTSPTLLEPTPTPPETAVTPEPPSITL